MSAPARFTHITCAECGETAPSTPTSQRMLLVSRLMRDGWRLTLGEATCPRCIVEQTVPGVEVGA